MSARTLWFVPALAAVGLVAFGGDAAGRASDATAERRGGASAASIGMDAQPPRRSWLRWLPALLAQEPAPVRPVAPTPPSSVPPPTRPASLGAVGAKAEEQVRFFDAVGTELLGPGYAAFAAAAGALAHAAHDYCTPPGGGALAALPRGWRRTMAAWQRVQHLRAGPVEEDNRRLRIHWFPDTSRAVERNLAALLDGSQPITEEVVRNSPTGAQGLPALERLIFAGNALAVGSRRCEATAAIADNVDTMARDVAAAWQEGGGMVEAFASGSDPFLDLDDVLVAILESIAVQAEFVSDQKIARGLRAGDASLLESPFAAHSKENVAANLKALADLIDHEHGGVYRLRDYLLRAHGEAAVGDQLAAAAAEAQARLAAMAGSFEDIVAGRAAGDLEGLRVDFQRLSNLGVEAAVAAGVNLGFNSEDGD